VKGFTFLRYLPRASQLKVEPSPTVRAPCAIDCGHIFCSTCIDSISRLGCSLCRSYFDHRAVRRLHIDVAPQTPNTCPPRVGRTDNNGADGGHYQALIQETCGWLKEQTPEGHWDLRALYLLLTRYHQMHKDEQAATVSLHEKTKRCQDALCKVEKRQREVEELKQIIEDLKDKMDSNEVKWTVREKQLTMKLRIGVPTKIGIDRSRCVVRGDRGGVLTPCSGTHDTVSRAHGYSSHDPCQCTFQDWYHGSCLNLRTRPSSRIPIPEIMVEENGVAQQGQDDDSRSDTSPSSSGLPPPLVTAKDYDALVCRSCVSQIPIFQAWVGTPGVAMVVCDDPDSSWKIIGVLLEDHLVVDDSSETESQTPLMWKHRPESHIHTYTTFIRKDTSSSSSMIIRLGSKSHLPVRVVFPWLPSFFPLISFHRSCHVIVRSCDPDKTTPLFFFCFLSFLLGQSVSTFRASIFHLSP